MVPHFIIENKSDPCLGTVLFVHGLNVRPSAFVPYAEALSEKGYRGIIVTLAGHDGKKETRFHPSAERWVAETEEALDFACSFEEPVYAIGFSAGGLTLTAALDRKTRPISAMVFLAPALSLRMWVSIARLALHVAPKTLPLLALVPKKYRSSQFTVPCWYAALMALYDGTRSIAHPEQVGRIPTAIHISRYDEFISTPALRRWIEHNQLANWKVHPVAPRSGGFSLAWHLILDENCFGATAWHELIDSTLELFQKYAARP